MNEKTLKDIDFEKRSGLLPVIVQDRKTKDILMMAYANREALGNTVKTGNAWFWSTSRNKLWMKGEESGNVQPVHEILVDCDSDAILYMVEGWKRGKAFVFYPERCISDGACIGVCPTKAIFWMRPMDYTPGQPIPLKKHGLFTKGWEEG